MEIDKFRVDLYPHQFLTGTMQLSPEDRGVYVQIIMLLYIHRGRLRQDYDLIKNSANCSLRLAKAVVGRLIDMGKLRVDEEGYLVNNRAENVLKDVRIRSEKALNSRRIRAEKEAKPNKINGKSRKSNLLESELDKEDTKVSSPPTPKGDAVSGVFKMPDGTELLFDQLFERYWHNYPAIRDKGHKGKAKDELLKKLKEKGSDYEIIGRGITKYRKYCDRTGEKQPDFFRWIRDEGYLRDYTLPAIDAPKHGRASDNSLESALSKALADRTHQPDISPERRKELGLDHDTGDV